MSTIRNEMQLELLKNYMEGDALQAGYAPIYNYMEGDALQYGTLPYENFMEGFAQRAGLADYENFMEGFSELERKPHPGSMVFFDPVTGEPYTDSEGNVLRPLVFDPLVVGEMSDEVPIVLRNEAGYAMRDVRVELERHDDVFGISRISGPLFEHAEEVVFEGTFGPDSVIGTFYIRADLRHTELVGNYGFTLRARAERG